jgi:mannosyltransferase
MTPPAGRVVLGGRAQAATGKPEPGATGYDAGPAWAWFLPPAVMLVLGLWGITGPSYWRDEAATMTAVGRPFAEVLRMMGHIDAVHGVYYMVIWVVVRLGGTGEVVTRLPSVLAMAGAAAAVAALGRRLVSPAAGLAAGLLFAVLPQISLYAQDAREYAFVTALACTGSYLLVRAMTTAGRRRGLLGGYAVCLGVMGLLNVFSLLLIGAHAITVALAGRRAGWAAGWAGRSRSGWSRSGRSRSGWSRSGWPRSGWPLAVAWLAAAAGAFVIASPVLALGYNQRGTLRWLTTPQLVSTVTGLRELIGPADMVIALVLAAAIGLLLTAGGGRAALRAAWPARLLELSVPWLVLPPLVLIGISYLSPVYTFRYILFCAPAAALLGGAGLASLRWPASGTLAWIPAAAGFALVAVLGIPAQQAARAPDGHGTNIKAANAIVAGHRRPGDAVLYVGNDSKYFPAAYPSGFVALDNIAQRKTPSQAANLVGTDYRTSVVRLRLARVPRVWVVRIGSYPRDRQLDGLDFRLVGSWHTSDIWLLLYARG